MTMKAAEFLEYIKEAKSKATYKNYKQGLKKFTTWYKKTEDEILEERFQDLQSTEQHTRRHFNREIEKFHRHLRNLGHPQNTAVAYTEGIRQLLRFYDMDIKGLPTEVTRKVITTKDFVPTVSQYRDMFHTGSILDRTIISMSLDLGWRIGDFIKQLKVSKSDYVEACVEFAFYNKELFIDALTRHKIAVKEVENAKTIEEFEKAWKELGKAMEISLS